MSEPNIEKKISASDDATQSERFIQIARDFGCDETEERFNEALKKVARAKPAEETKPETSSKVSRKRHL